MASLGATLQSKQTAMQVGDRVALLDSTEEGVLEKLQGDTAVVLLDDGLEIEVSPRNLIVVKRQTGTPQPIQKPVSAKKSAPLPSAESNTEPPPVPILKQPTLREMLPEGPGLLLAETETGRLQVWGANPEKTAGFLALYRQPLGGEVWELLAYQTLEAETVLLVQDLPSGDRDRIAKLLVYWQGLPTRADALPATIMKPVRLNQQVFRQPSVALVAPDIRGIYLPLRELEAPAQSRIVQGFQPPLPTADNPVVDLHIEKIAPHLPGLSNTEKLMFQLAHAEKALDEAVRLGLPELVFIHGIGRGVLRNKLNELLKGHQNVAVYFLDDSGKYGNGATQAVLI